MKILDLSLTYKWFDMIACGYKKQEYREIKPFYLRRLCYYCFKENLCQNNIMCECLTAKLCSDNVLFSNCWNVCFKDYDIVRFHRGQGGKLTMLCECKQIRIGFGKIEWGAPEDKEVFIIELGKILKL